MADAGTVLLGILGALGGAGGMWATFRAGAAYVAGQIEDGQREVRTLLDGQIADLREGYARLRDERDALDAEVDRLTAAYHQLELTLARIEAQEGQPHAPVRTPP